MPPSLASRDSPRTQHGRRRAPRGQLVRSNSLFGAIKSMVTAPFSWLTTYDDHENPTGKRGRNLPNAVEDDRAYHEDQPSAKRKRIDSPEPVPQANKTYQGYLDVPERFLISRHRQETLHGHGRSSSLVPSLSIPVVSGAHPARRTTSPIGIVTSAQPSGMSRTQSMDPPVYRAISLSRDVSMEEGLPGSVSRDVTMSPSRRTPFQLRARSSLTPQPNGQTFGPTPRHKERDTSEPPPLAALISNPVFVKAPPQMTHSQSEQPLTTLGSLAEANGVGRSTRSPLRQHSSLFFGARSGSVADSRSTPAISPINAAEQALHDLDVYKTPLLPSRLRGSQTIPDMFKPKKAHAPVLMRRDRERERKPRLGTSEKKGKKKDEEHSIEGHKPYAGRGGTKKMLARRKLEEHEELEKDRENAIETDQDDIVDKEPEVQPIESPKKGLEVVSPPTAAPTRPIGGREQSSLRVGRTRTSRNHPVSVPFTKNRFSAVFDDDEGEDSMIDESREQVEVKKLPILYESPKGFTFAQDKTPVLQDSSNTNALPIPTLPFSLTKTPAVNGTATISPMPVTPAKVPAVEMPVTIVSAVPSISLIPPSPAPAKPAEVTHHTQTKGLSNASDASSVPNFFANSSIFSRPGVTIAPPAPSSLTDASNITKKENRNVDGAPAFSFANTPSAQVAQASVFHVEPTKADQAPTSTFGEVASRPPEVSASLFPPSKSNEVSSSNPFAVSPVAPGPVHNTVLQTPAVPSTLFSFPIPKPKEEVQASPAPKPAFNFTSAPVSDSSTNTTPVVASAPTVFSFAPKETPKVVGSQVSLGSNEPTKLSLFNTSTPSPAPFADNQTNGDVHKPSFSFGSSTPSPSVPAATIEAPKSLFPSASTSTPSNFDFGPGSTTTHAAKANFSFGIAPLTPSLATPVESKPAFTFGLPSTSAPSAPSTLFGGPSTGSQRSDVLSKNFGFGGPTVTSTPARPLTPPHKEHDMRMEESPTRDGAMDINGDQQPSLKPSEVFTFNAPNASGSSPFGRTSNPASAFSFAKTEVKQETKVAPTFANFGQSASSFSFAPKPTETLQSPLSPAPFGTSNPFGQAANTPTTTSPAFPFNGPTSNGFGQPPSAINSQPASPSFGAPAPAGVFSFGATPTSATSPFAFGSQPASPAGVNAGLPQPPGSSGGHSFAFAPSGSTNAAVPSSPFGAPPSLPTPAGTPTFTMGSAPTQASSARPMKKLPARRGGRR